MLTGDYLAELTMLILGKDQLKDPSLGYARTFVRQVEDCLGLALEQGVRIVANAGGLNPAGLADRLREVAAGLGLDPQIAHVEGDDLRRASASADGALTANAYLGGFGIAAALDARAPTSSSPAGSPTPRSSSARRSRTTAGRPTSYDELAGAVVAGHVIECGTQATGGNFSGFLDLPARRAPLGFPIAEIAADGVERDHQARRHRRRGHRRHRHRAARLRDPVDPLPRPRRHRPPRHDPARAGRPRTGSRSPASAARPRRERLKVCVNELGGFRNQVEFVLTGLDVEEKAAWVREQLDAALDGGRGDVVAGRRAAADADTEEGASPCSAARSRTPTPDPVGRAFTGRGRRARARVVPRLHDDRPARQPATPYGVYRPEYVDRAEVDAHRRARRRPPRGRRRPAGVRRRSRREAGARRRTRRPPTRLTRRMPLGTFVHARSGDKGGDANIGLWVAHDGVDRRRRGPRAAGCPS